MSGSKIGGLKAAKTNKKRYGKNYYKKMGMTKRIIQNIKEADLVTCTNNLLASKILKLNKNVCVIPNAID